ncbi:TonB family protein [Salinisphaera sp. T31B1]|uniref:energy transducer TonB n=1 Tax=Salinisphaera sp. T31B1 TaxID=727963 RepID=UPI003342C7E0
MSERHTRLILCVALALACHVALLGWAVGTNPTPADRPLRTTRAAGEAAAATPTDVVAAQDQRGSARYSQQARFAGLPSNGAAAAAQRANAGQTTRFVVVANQQAGRERSPQTLLDRPNAPDRVSRAARIHSAVGDPRARYLAAWQDRIEALGSRRYPSELLSPGEPRRLTLAVRLAPDGRLLALRVVHSSGQPALDRAALSIVRDAAPFAAFGQTLGDDAGTLSFAYDWLFEAGAHTRLRPAG